jgi:hypothetical protein
MRAVPDDFDSVQALHSPYGAVHAIGTPLQSPVDFVPGYGDHILQRPLMVDTMRRDHDEHMSPTGLSPAFGHIGFAPPGSITTSDVLSPLSLSSQDRYYGSHLSSPLSAGPRSGNPFDRQNSYPARQQVRSLQPLQLRETLSRARSDSLQSPLRTSMSWKGDSIDYANYQTGQPSPRQQSVYQSDQGSQISSNGSVNASQPQSQSQSQSQYDASTYSSKPSCLLFPCSFGVR